LHHPDDALLYRACWVDGEEFLSGIPEQLLDLSAFMVARRLLAQGYNSQRLLVVHLHGADYDLMRAPLGAAAAPPLVNFAASLKEPARVEGLRHG
jgi:hypothetical protein